MRMCAGTRPTAAGSSTTGRKKSFGTKFRTPRDSARPIQHGQLTQPEWRDLVVSTPPPLEWDCFRFGLIQHENHCSLFAIVDHLHCDPAVVSSLYVEILTNYRALLEGKPPLVMPEPGSHDNFCIREAKTSADCTWTPRRPQMDRLRREQWWRAARIPVAAG